MPANDGTLQSTERGTRRSSPEWLSREYFPAVDRFLGWARTPVGALIAAAIAAALCGIFLHPNGFVVFLAIVLVLIFGLVWPWLSVRGLSALLQFGRTRMREGEPVTIRLALRNRAPWAVFGIGVHFASGDLQEGRSDGCVAFVGGRTTSENRWQFSPNQRGEYPRRAPQLSCGFPFGLWHASRAVAVARPLLVWPRIFPVGPLPLTAGDRSCDGAVFRNKAGTTGDLLGVRPYRRGDSLRRIHWPQTARHGRLVVCELQSPAHPLVQIVVDTDPRVHGGQGADSSREWAIRIAASFMEGWLRDGAQVEAVIGGALFPGKAGAAQIPVLLDALARVLPELGLSLAQLSERPAWKNFDGGLRVVITTDRALAEVSAAVLRDTRQRFVVLRADSFIDEQPAAHPSAALPVEPWILIDGPANVPASLRTTRKETAHDF
jgi:uncharacterized protein (DUF58 family)